MIVRAASTLGLVWLLMPHHPDLGLPVPAAAPGGAITREAVFQSLREVREELRQNKKYGDGSQFSEREITWTTR
jgi:hypothetical protein